MLYCYIFIILNQDVIYLKKLFCALTATAVSSVALFALKEAKASKGNAEGEKDYLLILGYRLENDEAAPALKMRCAKAAEYLHEHKNTVAIACGGITGKTQKKSEAQVIKELLMANGIEEERILLEDKSTTTAENFYNAKKIIGDTADVKIALVSSERHLLRSSVLAKKCGLEVQTVAAPSPKGAKLTGYIKEFFVFPFIFQNLKEAEKRG